jgi:hypothetical protein
MGAITTRLPTAESIRGGAHTWIGATVWQPAAQMQIKAAAFNVIRIRVIMMKLRRTSGAQEAARYSIDCRD